MTKLSTPALKKNPLIKNLKKSSNFSKDVKNYNLMAKASKNHGLNKDILLNQKILLNHKILSARVKQKVKNLSQADQKLAEKLFENMYSKVLLNTFHLNSNNQKYFEFVKGFSKSINRREGKVVLEIIKSTSEIIKQL